MTGGRLPVCVVCRKPWRRQHEYGRCCSQPCSLAFSALKRLKTHLGPWKPAQRDQWGALIRDAARAAWKA